jgi:hypothetical protein
MAACVIPLTVSAISASSMAALTHAGCLITAIAVPGWNRGSTFANEKVAH